MNFATQEGSIRLLFFFGILSVMALLEAWFPRRDRVLPRIFRWPSNLIIVFIDTFVVRAFAPMTAMAMAYWVEKKSIGLFQANLALPHWLKIVLVVLALDFIVYLQHLMFHAVPLFWKFHKIHHADREFDVTTGLRFHPIEILISLVIKLSAIYVIGAEPWAVLIFEILLNSTAQFNHSNFKINENFDGALRLFIVTPDTHRVHHSVEERETQSNFGFNFPWWDRLFGTYCAQPKKGHLQMVIGLPEYQKTSVHRLDWIILGPWLPKGP